MSVNQYVLDQLQQLLSWKKSKKFYASKLGVSDEELENLLLLLKQREQVTDDAEAATYIGILEDHILKFEEDIVKGTGEIVFNSKEEIRTLDELIEKCNIDTEKWEITKYVQNYWGNKENPHWQVKAWLGKKKEEQVFQDVFVKFLETYTPCLDNIPAPQYEVFKAAGCLIINKQDAHYNKFDISGDNEINDRFEKVMSKTKIILEQAKLSSNLESIKYIVGSDEFNSEFTGTTTKGTPQTNILTYHDSFIRICDHEASMIQLLLGGSDVVEVVYIAGNHDEYIGWHLITWLEAFFRGNERVVFDISPRYRKYERYGNSAMMFNHGDAIKPSKLAAIFPIEFREEWSYYKNFYIFTGDKHHEVSHDFNGIKFYQLPAISTAKGLWDDKNGHVGSKAEITAFLLDDVEGISNIFKQSL
jgi:hypothetical protein